MEPGAFFFFYNFIDNAFETFAKWEFFCEPINDIPAGKQLGYIPTRIRNRAEYLHLSRNVVFGDMKIPDARVIDLLTILFRVI